MLSFLIRRNWNLSEPETLISGTKQVDGYEQKRIREDEWTYILLVIDFFSRFLWEERGVQESLEITSRSHEYKIDLQSPVP